MAYTTIGRVTTLSLDSISEAFPTPVAAKRSTISAPGARPAQNPSEADQPTRGFLLL